MDCGERNYQKCRATCGGHICFEVEAGFARRPSRGHTWDRRRLTPVVAPGGRRPGRRSVAGLIAKRTGSPTRLGTRRSMGECDLIVLIGGIHQLLKPPIVLVRDRLNSHDSYAMSDLIAERGWLTVFPLPAYPPDPKPVEWV